MAKKLSVATDTASIQLAELVEQKPRELHPEIRKIADDAARGLQYSFLAAALQQEVPFAAGSVEESFRLGIRSRPPEARDALKAKALKLANAPVPTRVAAFGRYANLDVKAHGLKGFHQAILQLPPVPLKGSVLAPLVDMMKADVAANAAAKKEEEKVKIHFAPVGGLSFYITQVRCLDETDGFLGSEAGDDEIVVGGLAVDSAGITRKVTPFLAGSEFDDGDKVVFSGAGHQFYHFEIAKGGRYPKLHTAILMIAEEDWGGFADAVNSAYQAAFPSIKKAYEEAIDVVLTTMTPLPGPVADKIAEIYVDVVGGIVDTVVNFLLMFVGDDVFSARHSFVRLHTPVALAYANTGKWKNGASPIETHTFKGHGGKYTVKGYWKVDSGK